MLTDESDGMATATNQRGAKQTHDFPDGALMVTEPDIDIRCLQTHVAQRLQKCSLVSFTIAWTTDLLAPMQTSLNLKSVDTQDNNMAR